MWDLQQKAKQIIIEEFFLVHNANRVKADCRVKKHLEISEAWRESLQQIREERGYFILQSSLSHLWFTKSLRHLSREERGSGDKEEKVISLSGRLAHVGFEGLRHKPHCSVPSNFLLTFLSNIQELAYREGQML